MSKIGIIFDIQRMSLNNGSGLRTSIFLKGCPLRCLWCHNPEAELAKPELFYKPEKCIGCGRCAEVCGNHVIEEGRHIFDRTNCIGCMNCTMVCPMGALEKIGREMTVDDVMQVILRDKTFFDTSGGGVTITGGEPLFQSKFTLLLTKECKKHGINVNIDTCGYAPTEKYEFLAEYADVFLFDIKETDSVLHRQYTGVDNELILQNLHRLDELGKTIVLRCPIIPGLNARVEHLRGIAKLANSLKHSHEINIIPYHPLGVKKLDWLDRENMMSEQSFPEPKKVQEWIRIVAAETDSPVSMA